MDIKSKSVKEKKLITIKFKILITMNQSLCFIGSILIINKDALKIYN